jgi:hypothetical protein
VNRYRFAARKGERLVIATAARQLIPYIADAVPGWFQPVLTLYDARGKEVAYNNDDRFKPDPLILFEVPRDGEYCCTITDALYRGREDFVYRVTIGELPFVMSIFPLGSRVGNPVAIGMKGWNLDAAELTPPARDAGPGIYFLEANKQGLVSNCVPFALDTLPESMEKEPNNDPASAQKVDLPIIVNGCVDGFTGPIKLGLKDPPEGFSAAPVSLSGAQEVARLNLKTTLTATQEPVTLCVQGSARIQGREVVRQGVPAEDRMQAFLWRHLVPAEDLRVTVFDPSFQPPPKRVSRVLTIGMNRSKPSPREQGQSFDGMIDELMNFLTLPDCRY